MNNFKWQYYVGKCKMDFPIVTRIPLNRTASGIPTVSLRWTWIIDNRHRLSSVIVARNTKSWGTEEPRKNSHMHRNRLVMLEVALKSHEHLGTSQHQHKKLSLWVCWQTKCQRLLFTTHLSTSCGRSFGYGMSF